MNPDDLGRRAGRDLRRTSQRLDASLPTGPAVVARAQRRRLRRAAVVLGTLVITLGGGVAFAVGNSAGGGGAHIAIVGGPTAPSDDVASSVPTTNAATTVTTVSSCDLSGETGATGENVGPDCATTTTSAAPDGADDATTPTTDVVIVLPDEPPDSTTTTIPETATTTPSGIGTGLGRVSGYVRAGPTCPVEQPDQLCADAGIVADITFTMVRDDAEFLYERTTTSKADGSYSIELAPGHFWVSVRSDAAMSCTDSTVDVTEGEEVVLDLTCDTGIR
jgi:hypothetical protein